GERELRLTASLCSRLHSRLVAASPLSGLSASRSRGSIPGKQILACRRKMAGKLSPEQIAELTQALSTASSLNDLTQVASALRKSQQTAFSA
ncbi:unnamed protein product, partial [Polarella glacialis]